MRLNSEIESKLLAPANLTDEPSMLKTLNSRFFWAQDLKFKAFNILTIIGMPDWFMLYISKLSNQQAIKIEDFTILGPWMVKTSILDDSSIWRFEFLNL